MAMINVKNVKNIWLSSADCPASAITGTRRLFTFYDLPLIQIRKNSYLRVNSVTLSGVGSPQAIDQNWIMKLHNVGFNNQAYFNSDKTAEPTIINFNYDIKNSVQNGLFSLELLPQDINQLSIEIYSNVNAGASTSGGNFDFYINLIVEEIED